MVATVQSATQPRWPRPWTLAVVLVATLAAYSYLGRVDSSPLASDCLRAEMPLACEMLPGSPAVLHAASVALHLINTALAMAIFLEWLPPLAALLASLFFALHPVQAEAVSLAHGWPELTAAFFALVSMLVWRRRHPWPAAALFAVSLACGPTAVALPAFLAAFETSMGGELRRGIRALQFMSAMAVAALVWWMVNSGLAATGIVSAAPVLGHWAKLLAVPFGFSIWPIVNQSAGARFASWMLLAAMTGAALTAFRKLRLGFWFVAFVALALPTFLLHRGAEAASDRHLYLPMLAVAAIVGRVFESTQLRALIPAGALLLAALTFTRGATFQSAQMLWEEAAQHAPGELRPRLEMARLAPPRRALEMLLESRALFPNDPRIAEQMAQVYLDLHLPGEAVTEFGRALAKAPGRADLHLGRGQALVELSLNDAALNDFELALAMDPCYEPARAALHLPALESCQQKQNRPR